MTGLVLLGGAVAGSAAGAALHRWPLGATMTNPRRSCCSFCGAGIRPAHLVPVISWLLLRGRCSECDGRIDARLFILEVLSACIAVVTVRIYGLTAVSLVLVVGIVGALLAALIDHQHLIIPDRLTMPLAVWGLIAIPVVADAERWASVVLWALGAPAVLLFMNAIADLFSLERPIGGGDIKLLVGVLALSGVLPSGPQIVMLGTLLLSGIAAGVGVLSGHLGRKSRIPLAPSIAGALLSAILAPSLAEQALHLMSLTT